MTEDTTQGRILVMKTVGISDHWLYHHHHAQRQKATNRHFQEYALAPLQTYPLSTSFVKSAP